MLPEFSDIISSIPMGLILLSFQGRIEFLNEKASELLGAADLIRPEANFEFLPEPLLSLAREVSRSGENRWHMLLSSDSGAKGPTIAASFCTLQQGSDIRSVLCFLINLDDMLAHSVDLNALHNAHTQLDAILETSNDGIWIYDKDAKVLNVSRYSEKMCGLNKNKLIGRTNFELTKANLWDEAFVPEAMRSKQKVSGISKLTHSNIDALVTATPVLDANGNVALVVVNERDITQLKDLEEELKQARDEAEAYKFKVQELIMEEFGRHPDIIAESESMRNVLRMIRRLAQMKSTNILILGESGTGKGVLAKFFHSSRHQEEAPFIQINCAALPESLLETELFGYEKGAFTGARQQGKPGLFEMANHGTLFLDEIGEMPLALQSKLLIYLDNNEVLPLGATRPKKVYCSIIAATNCNIEELVAKKRFREDLFYRLNNFTIPIPPIRERPEDIEGLTNYFLKNFNKKYMVKKKISPKGIACLQSYSFPGNIRELQSLINRALVLCEADFIDEFIISCLKSKVIPFAQCSASPVRGNAFNEKVANLERDMLEDARGQCRTTRDMARYLGISQASVVRKLKKFGLSNATSRRKRGR